VTEPRRPIDADRRRPADAPTHPKLAAALLMIGVVVLLFGVAVLSVW
jgi:hypothetical protein